MRLMINKKEIFNILKIGITLCLITAISALVLASVNAITEPVIAANNQKKKTAAMKVILPEANEFAMIVDVPEYVDEMYAAINEYGEKIGYAVMVSPNGYGGEISLAVGINKDLTVSAIDIISQTETAGLGSNCTSSEFKDQFSGKSGELIVKKNATANNEIDAITSATVTSKAVTLGVNDALKAVKEKGELAK